jgi:hypothetical protein
MPPELIIMGAALLVGAWLVLDQRSLKDKFMTVLIVLAIYIVFQWLSGKSFSEISGQFTKFLPKSAPPVEENEDR